jgi:hypothetical protein
MLPFPHLQGVEKIFLPIAEIDLGGNNSQFLNPQIPAIPVKRTFYRVVNLLTISLALPVSHKHPHPNHP